jgi:nucleotide-binding universal stress UspA family protein
VLSLAAERNVDLIVMGTHGRRGFDHLVLGSVAERVLRKAPCPVLVIRDPTRTFVDAGNREDPVNIQRILFCTDFDDNSPRALEYALSLALQYGSGISLLHVIEVAGDVPGLEEERQLALQQLDESIPEDAHPWARVVSTVRTGKPSREIIDYASEIHADLIVMGVRGRGAVDLTLFGSTTHRVVQLAQCPVLVVRT